MPLRPFWPLRLALLLLLSLSGRLRGQATDNTPPWDQRGWLFVGVGGGSIKESLAVTGGGSYSAGPLMLTLRRGEARQWYGDGIDGTAFLIGARSTGTRGFVSAQLGPSAVHRFHTCDCSGNDWTGPTHGALAFDVAIQGNWMIAGIGFDAFGNLLPSSHRYAAFAVMVELGWFGRDHPDASAR